MNDTYGRSWDRYSQAWKEAARESGIAVLHECVVGTCMSPGPNAVVEQARLKREKDR